MRLSGRNPHDYEEMKRDLAIGLNGARDCMTTVVATIAEYDGTGYWGDTAIRDEAYRIRDEIMALAKKVEEKEMKR